MLLALALNCVSLSDYKLLEIKIEEYISDLISRNKISGVSLIYQDNDSILINKSFGMKDIEGNISLSIDDQYEWGSITSLLVFASILQLKEKELLSLNVDVEEYLGSGILQRKKHNITLLDIFNHQTGWDSTYSGKYIKDYSKLISLESYVRDYEPYQFAEAKKYFISSTYAVAVAGLVVEKVANESLVSYVEKNIFEPLGLKNTTFDPEVNRSDLSIGYVNYKKYLVESPFIGCFSLAYPAMGTFGTLSDMHRFVKALFTGEGLFSDPETALFFTDIEGKHFGIHNGLIIDQYNNITTLELEGHGLVHTSFLLYVPHEDILMTAMIGVADEKLLVSDLPRVIFGFPLDLNNTSSYVPDGHFISTRRAHSSFLQYFTVPLRKPKVKRSGNVLIFNGDTLKRFGESTFVSTSLDSYNHFVQVLDNNTIRTKSEDFQHISASHFYYLCFISYSNFAFGGILSLTSVFYIWFKVKKSEQGLQGDHLESITLTGSLIGFLESYLLLMSLLSAIFKLEEQDYDFQMFIQCAVICVCIKICVVIFFFVVLTKK